MVDVGEAATRERPGQASAAGSDATLVPEPGPQAGPDLVLIEVDDLVGYLGQYGTLTGIQRVQVNILRHLLPSGAPGGKTGRDLACAAICHDADDGTFWQVDADAVGALLDHCARDRLDRHEVAGLVRALERRRTPLRLLPGQCLLVLGCFWTHGTMERYQKAKRGGLTVGVLLYDLIPLTHPELSDAGLVRDVTLSLGDGLALFDFVLAISEATAREVRRHLAAHGLPPRPVEVVPLAHLLRDAELGEADGGQPGAGQGQVLGRGAWTGALAPLRGRPYVLCVGTIEARKNHAYLLACWKLLQQEGVATPDLVLVGRQGLRVADLMDQLRATRAMDGRVHVLHGLSDGELETLYRHCLFTAYVSFVEGWGLPIGESLAHGAPCIASGAASLPEVGGDLVDYVDPYCVRGGAEVFRRMVVDASYREERRAEIRARFRSRTWGQVASDLRGHVARLRGAGSPEATPLLRAGELFSLGDLYGDRAVPAGYASRPLRLILAGGWHHLGTSGAWTRGREALLRFATPLEEGAEIIVHLVLRGTPGPERHPTPVTVAVGPRAGTTDGAAPGRGRLPLPAEVTMPVPDGAAPPIRLRGHVGVQGVVEIGFLLGADEAGGDDVDGDDRTAEEPDRRRPAVAIAALAYAPRHDAALRADLADAFPAR